MDGKTSPCNCRYSRAKHAVIHSYQLMITPKHVDGNDHVNYKVYVFGGFVCIREAILLRSISKFIGHSPDDVITNESRLVFLKECTNGDDICFKLYEAIDDDDYYVACYKDDILLAYGKYSLMTIANGKLWMILPWTRDPPRSSQVIASRGLLDDTTTPNIPPWTKTRTRNFQ